MARRPVIALSLLSVFLLGSVAEQRARLPPPSTDCSDPAAGTWVSHTYFAHVGEWYRFSIALDRQAGGSLTGVIRSDFWDGGPDDAGPVACGSGWNRQGVVEQAAATFDGTTLTIDATSWSRDPNHACGEDRYQSYSLDHFAGQIDPATAEFQALLNATGPWKDVPIVFRHVSCGDSASSGREPSLNRGPPPPRIEVSRGWSCW